MKTLLLLRHAKSSWKDSLLPDHERPLNDRGKRAAPRMGRLIRELDLVPDQILSSTAVRARTTASVVAEHCGFDGVIELNRALYEADVETLIHEIAEVHHDDSRVMVVAHNPGLDELLFALTHVEDHLPTAALAHITLPINSWRGLSVASGGTLVKIWRPRELD